VGCIQKLIVYKTSIHTNEQYEQHKHSTHVESPAKKEQTHQRTNCAHTQESVETTKMLPNGRCDEAAR